MGIINILVKNYLLSILMFTGSVGFYFLAKGDDFVYRRKVYRVLIVEVVVVIAIIIKTL